MTPSARRIAARALLGLALAVPAALLARGAAADPAALALPGAPPPPVPRLSAPAPVPNVQSVTVFQDVRLHFEETRPERTDGSFTVRWESQVAIATVDLPDPAPGGRPRAIRAVLDVSPIRAPEPGAVRLVDPWTRLGMVSVAPVDRRSEQSETELIRFTTGYGAGGRYEADVTDLAPLLTGRRMFRVFVATYGDTPGWRATLRLEYLRDDAGRRDPLLAAPVFDAPHVHAGAPTLRRTLVVPGGVDGVRLRIITSGHATDGRGANEFESAVHELRIDGQLVARWRPWRQNGADLRPRNPMAGRIERDGRPIRASDLDRSGWGPGLMVEPLVIPLPELGPGRATLELRILGIREPDPADPDGEHGYFAVNATLVADRAWE